MLPGETAAAFNEWMRRYIEEPERFTREMTTVKRFLKQEQQGRVPTYGENCARYLAQLLTELATK